MLVSKNNYSIEHFHNLNPISNTNNLSHERSFHLNYSLEKISFDGNILEFGVHTGSTINQIAKKLTNKQIHGFDSFEGLPEDWPMLEKHYRWPEKIRHKKGYFALDKLPTVLPNVKLWRGWFDNTIPQYLETEDKDISFLHVDCDLYSSSKTVLSGLNDYIVKDTIIVFDDFYSWGHKRYETWEEGEYKALKEWLEEYDRSVELLTRNNHMQCCVRVSI